MQPPPARASFFLICHSYPPIIGGSEIEAQRVCAALRDRGYRAEVVCAGGPPMPSEERWRDPMGIPVRTYGGQGRWGTYRYVWGVLRTLWSERRNYDFVYFLMPGLQVLAGTTLARLLRKPVLMKFSGSNEVRKLEASLSGRLELACLRRWANRILVLNAGMFAEADEAGFRRAQVGWMPNPVDTSVFKRGSSEERRVLRERLSLAPEGFVVTYVGRLSPEKELPVLLGGFDRAARSLPHAQLVLVGDGPERASLERSMESLETRARIRMAGSVAPKEVLGWLQASDVFVLPSRLEGFPVSLTEAMSVGLPSVVSAIPGNLQLVEHGRNGLTFPVGDDQALAAALRRVAGQPEEARRMGDAARDLIESRYSTRCVVDLYEAIFAELLPGCKRPQ